nr:NCS2 family permease [Candidatus Pantoea persica]
MRAPGYRSRLRWILPLLLVVALTFPFLSSKYLLTVAILGLIYVLLELGHVPFYAIGAYGLALGYQYLGLGFWSMLPLAALAGALFGFLVLCMHGDYLAIVTLGFGEIIRLVLTNWLSFTGGPNGVSVPSPTFLGLEFGRRASEGGTPFHEFFHLDYNPNMKFIFIYVVLVLFIKHRLTRMPIGRAWALREDKIACRAMGLNHVLVKLSAFIARRFDGGHRGRVFRQRPGLRQSDLLYLLRVGADPRHRGAARHGIDAGHGDRRLCADGGPGVAAQLRRILRAAVRHADGESGPRGLVRTTRVGVAPRKGVRHE